ncbi:15443_t:CDS:2, partial [Acaulospora colombiana]
KAGRPLEARNVVGTVKFGGGSTMLWGSMTASGVGRMSEVEGRMDEKQYVEILTQNLLPSLAESGPNDPDFIFQQDNDPKHTSKLAKKWFADNSIPVLRWPSQSPDLNPIEHLWAHLKRKLNAYPTSPKSIQELNARIEQEWNQIDPQVQRLPAFILGTDRIFSDEMDVENVDLTLQQMEIAVPLENPIINPSVQGQSKRKRPARRHAERRSLVKDVDHGEENATNGEKSKRGYHPSRRIQAREGEENENRRPREEVNAR